MKDFLEDILIDTFRDGLIGCVFGIIFWIFATTLVVLTFWLFVWLIDSSFLPLKESDGVVLEKHYTPAHTTTTYIMSGKIMVPITNYISDSYEIEIAIENLKDDVSVSADDFENINVGNKVFCTYTNGRICNSLYIKSFCKK